jgi:hypothetical protein
MIRRTGVILFALAVTLSGVNAPSQTFLTRHTRDAVVNGTAPLLGPSLNHNPCASMSFWPSVIIRSC